MQLNYQTYWGGTSIHLNFFTQLTFFFFMTYVRKIYQIRLITSTFDRIESPIFQQRRQARAAVLAAKQNLTTSENKIENVKDKEKMNDREVVKTGNNWGRFF